MACGVHWKIRSNSDSISEGGGEQVGTDNRHQELQMDIMLEGFLLENNHRTMYERLPPQEQELINSNVKTFTAILTFKKIFTGGGGFGTCGGFFA